MTQNGQGNVTRSGERYVTPNAAMALDALKAILASPEFDGAGRVQAFLDYVVRETLEGRGDLIRGKTIVEDVYGRSPLEGRDPVAVVRVDAGRLRRRLANYYEGTGKQDELRISFKPGSYVPRFLSIEVPSGGPVGATNPAVAEAGRFSRWQVLLGLAVITLVAYFLWFLTLSQNPSDDERLSGAMDASTDFEITSARALRDALFSSSPARLQAANLAGRARGLHFPALEPEWQAAVLRMFELVIEMDENYFAGYAGAAESKALIALTRPPGTERNGLIAEADELATRALERGIDQSWSHSASALVAFVTRDFERARRESERALSLDPNDVHAVNTDGLISLFGGDFERAIEMANRAAGLMVPDDYFPNKSIRASAEFHLGNYSEARELIHETIFDGDPMSPISLGYLIAINTRLGEMETAREMLNLLETAWPKFPVGALFRSLYVDPAHAEEVVSALRASGWSGRGAGQD